MALHAEVNAFTCPGKWLYIKNKIQVNILFWLSMIFNCWPSYAFVRVPPENLFPISPPEKFATAWRFVPNTEIPLPPQWIPLLVFQVFPPLYIIIMCPLGPPFFLLLKVCFKTCLSLSPLHLNLYFYEKTSLYICLVLVNRVLLHPLSKRRRADWNWHVASAYWLP